HLSGLWRLEYGPARRLRDPVRAGRLLALPDPRAAAARPNRVRHRARPWAGLPDQADDAGARGVLRPAGAAAPPPAPPVDRDRRRRSAPPGRAVHRLVCRDRRAPRALRGHGQLSGDLHRPIPGNRSASGALAPERGTARPPDDRRRARVSAISLPGPDATRAA